MKKTLFTLALVAAFAGFGFAQAPAADAPAVNPNAAEFKFEEESFDFGTIKEGAQATHEFKFKNTGKEPLLVTNVQPSCGCTTPKWTKEPIKPGEEGSITAVYNSNGRPGAFNKQLTITSNTKTPTKLIYIKGTVEPKPKEDLTPVNPQPVGPTAKPKGGN